MRKFINAAFYYAVAAMAGGVFYREYTKLSTFTGQTALSVVHTHLFLMGMVFFLAAALMEGRLEITKSRKFKAFFGLYNGGVILTSVMLAARGVMQVMSMPMTAALDGAISGLAGVGHILTGAGIVLFFIILRERTREV